MYSDVIGHIADGVYYITIIGNIDMFSCKLVKERLYSLIWKTEKTYSTRIDLLDCHYIDSSGLGVLLGFVRMVKNAGKIVWIEGANQKVMDIIILAGLDEFFFGKKVDK